MGDAENCSRMDSSNSSSSDEAAEKRMKVDDSVQDPVCDSTTLKTENENVPVENENVPVENENVPVENENVPVENKNSNGNSNTDNLEDNGLNKAINNTAQIEKEVPGKEAEASVASSSTLTPVVQEEEEELEQLKVVFNKKQLVISISLNKTVGDLKKLIELQTKVAPALQKVLIKGIPKDEVTLKSLGVTKTTKIMVIGSSLDEVMSVSKPPDKETLAVEEAIAKKESNDWCTLQQHKKVIDKGVPDDAMPGILGNSPEPLPDIPLFGMLNSKGHKLRLTLKLEADELWIGTKERTEKISIGTIRNVISQPITGYEHYHIMAIQLGPTEASRFFVYWVPAQYVESIKDALGI